MNKFRKDERGSSLVMTIIAATFISLLAVAVISMTVTNIKLKQAQKKSQTNFYNYLGYQTLNYIDGSYWKIKTVSLGYTLPKSLTLKFGVSKLRAYITANNLFSFAKNHLIQDYDAERGGSAKAPLQRQLIFGLNLDF